MRILIADDDPTGREIARHLASGAGHQVEAVPDGAAALAALLSGRFDAALLDLYMPALGGAEVARAVRAAMPAGVRPLLIAVSAADPGPPAALGFDACLGKPLRLPAFVAALAGAPDAPPEERPPAAHPQLAELCARLAEALARGDAGAAGELVRLISALDAA